MSRCVVVSGADIGNYEAVKQYFKDDDYFIICDCGLRHVSELGIKPDLIVGDFDSFEKPNTDTEMIELPCEKDDTDTVYGVKEGIKRGFEEFMLIGAVGQRFDHTMANISILLMLDSLGLKGIIVDDYSDMEIVSSVPAYINDSYRYFSLLNISGTAKEINIENARYLLKDGEISPEYQYGVSNEVIKGKISKVTVGEGRLLLVKDR